MFIADEIKLVINVVNIVNVYLFIERFVELMQLESIKYTSNEIKMRWKDIK